MGLFNSKELEKLRTENQELKTKFHFMYEKENQAELLKKTLINLKKEIADTNKSKNKLMNEIEELKLKHKRSESDVDQMNKLILELDKKKLELKDTVSSYDSNLKDVSEILGESDINFDDDITNIKEAKTADEIESFISNLKNRLVNFKEAEEKLNKVIELKNLEINDLENKQERLNTEQNEIETKLEEKRAKLKEEEEKYEIEINKNKQKIEQLENKEEELLKAQNDLETKKNELSEIIEEINTDVKNKREVKGSLEVESLNLEKQIKDQNKKITQAQEKFATLDEKTNQSEKRLYEIEQSLEIKAKKLSSINTEIHLHEQKLEKIKDEIDSIKTEKEKLEADIIEQNNTIRGFDTKVEKLKELCALLETRRGEIEKGNLALENRFTNMFQKYNSELNKINKKRNLLEKIVLAKEQEIETKDQELYEKIASLEESERVLNLRQVEVDSLEKHIKTLTEKKDYLSNEININSREYDKQIKQKEMLKSEVQLLVNNKNNIDKDLQNLVDVMVSSYNRSEERRKDLEKDIKLYDEQLDTFKEKINESMNEMLEIQSNVSGLKLEHEELRSSISKLIKTKKKLHEDISKYQDVVQRYQSIKEKLKIEQAIAKNKELPGPFKGKNVKSGISLDKESESHQRSKLFKI
ncbi:MAG: hypothetical protein COW08_05470 [Ignavibacteriales bacterium CG12_big_fil_rev_8_21_14_0_65_30_8]|nr:MAG: hypothetical protein COW08_05470 [Ignavibacteriales bacterium CG12_big_fil_rev_8_21_14_0_65_30_8]